jgi:hypothetical protein
MRLSLIGAGALTVILLPAAFTCAADSPREDPLKEHELALRNVLDSWNDIATALSLIRDAPGARRNENMLQDSLLEASRTGSKMSQLKKPTKEQDRELCNRVLVRAREVRARLKSESDRVSAIPDLGPEMKPHMDKMILVGRTLDRIIARGQEQ